MPVKYNMDYRRATLSSQICNGQVSRDDALRILEAKPFDDEKFLKIKHISVKNGKSAKKNLINT